MQPTPVPIITPAQTQARVAFPGDSAGVRAMRVWLRTQLGSCARALDVELVATELASNAAWHTASQGWLFAVTVEHEQDGIRLVVQDLGSDTEPGPNPSEHARERGYGLTLVESLADAWGMCGNGQGRDVWAYWDDPL